MSSRKTLLVVASVILVSLMAYGASAAGLRARFIPEKPVKSVVEPGYDRLHIEVKFVDHLDIGLSAEGQPIDRSRKVLRSSAAQSSLNEIAATGGRWQRMTGDAEQRIDELRSTAEQYHGRVIADLNNYFILNVPENVSTEEWLDMLNALEEVEIALALPFPAPLPLPGSYTAQQGYLDAAPTGIDAWYAWTHGGGNGMLSTICDFEYSWNLDHHDFDTTWSHWATVVPMGYTASDYYNDNNHGTAVLGEFASMKGYYGTTGAAHGAGILTAPTYLDDGYGAAWLLGVAMNNAMTMGGVGRGDVMLIEQQFAGPNYTGSGDYGLIPVEWWQSWYNTILTATGNGIHVVECAGNGYQDLDDAVYNTGHAPFLPSNHSGAIIVGAGAVPSTFGGSDVDRSRLAFSNYGSRVDLQGWGEAVMTTGYGSYYSEAPDSMWNYTATFSGTSSAAPIVAAAVAIVEGVYQWHDPSGLAQPFGVDTVRHLLINTGSPQQSGTYPATQHIGPRPDLKAALAAFYSDACDTYKDPFVDYAPFGVPDFDQIRANWQLPDTRYTHDGPVALANCFWWFDSKYETGGTAPPTISDNYPLVQAYKAGIDDHDTANVIPLVDSLALYCGTNAGSFGPGTEVLSLAAGAQSWIDAQGLSSDYTVTALPMTTYDALIQVRDDLLAGQNIIMLLGFYQELGDGNWDRSAGHWVTLAGTCTFTGSFCISDPLLDMFEGEYVAVPGLHSSDVHNDAGIVSGPHGSVHHDRYDIDFYATLNQPFPYGLVGYPMSHTDMLDFVGVNPPEPAGLPAMYYGLPIKTLMEWAIIICPTGSGCCGLYTGGYTGNTDCDVNGKRNLADISKLIDRVYLTKLPLCCEENGDVNVDGKWNLADISRLIDHVYISKTQTAPCP